MNMMKKTQEINEVIKVPIPNKNIIKLEAVEIKLIVLLDFLSIFKIEHKVKITAQITDTITNIPERVDAQEGSLSLPMLNNFS